MTKGDAKVRDAKSLGSGQCWIWCARVAWMMVGTVGSKNSYFRGKRPALEFEYTVRMGRWDGETTFAYMDKRGCMHTTSKMCFGKELTA